MISWKKTTDQTETRKIAITIKKTTKTTTRKTTGTTTKKTGIIVANINSLANRIKVARNKEWPGIIHFYSKPFFILTIFSGDNILWQIYSVYNKLKYGGLLWILKRESLF